MGQLNNNVSHLSVPNPDYASRLQDRLSVVKGGDLIGTIYGEEIPDLPWLDLLNNGLVTGGGYARLTTSFEYLIYGQRFDDLRRVIEKLRIPTNVPVWLADLLKEDDPDAVSRSYMDRQDFKEKLGRRDKYATAFHLSFLDDSSEDWTKNWIEHFHFRLTNGYYGTDSKSDVESELSSSPVFLGRKLSSHFSNVQIIDEGIHEINVEYYLYKTASALSCLKQQVIDSEDACKLCKLASIWVTQFSDWEAGRAALCEAENKVLDEKRVIACPWTLWQVFGEKEAARKRMDFYRSDFCWEFDRELLGASGLLDFAELYADVGCSRDQLRMVLSDACELVKGFDEGLRGARLAWELLRDDELRLEMMTCAESSVREISDWYDITLQYGIEDKMDDVRRCLISAEKQANTVHDWDYLAMMTWHASQDEPLFRKYMGRAENLAQSANDWRTCAFTWESYLSKEEADRCSTRATALEKNQEGFV